MKKTNKRLLAAAGIFCAVGILFFGVGIASGGRNYVKLLILIASAAPQ